jgi:hypothetical protein
MHEGCADARKWSGPGIRESDAIISSVGAMRHTRVVRRLDARRLRYSGLHAAVPLPTTTLPTRPKSEIGRHASAAANRSSTPEISGAPDGGTALDRFVCQDDGACPFRRLVRHGAFA